MKIGNKKEKENESSRHLASTVVTESCNSYKITRAKNINEERQKPVRTKERQNGYQIKDFLLFTGQK